jgi:hypothetical protein
MQISGMLASRLDNAAPSLPGEALVGRYDSPLFGEIIISLEDGNLTHRYGETDLFLADLELWQETTYIVNYRNKINPPDFLTFLPDDQGRVASLAVKDADMFKRV